MLEPTNNASDAFTIGQRTYRSRLIIGTGKYKDLAETKAAIERSGAEIVTVALRRVSLSGESSILQAIPPGVALLPNTAGCYTAEEAVRTARLAREAGMTEFVKLEVIGDQRTLFPDVEETLKATKILVAEGFTVLPYTTDDPIAARKLEDLGAAAVMPLAAPIGSGLGIRNPYNLRIILESAKVPVIVDAGVGTASDAAFAMELGCDAVLMNTGIAGARNPLMMAEAMRDDVLLVHAMNGQPLLPQGASLTAREWLKFGQFLRDHGKWNGKQLIAKKLLDELVVGTKANPAYGLTFWLNRDGKGPGGRPGGRNAVMEISENGIADGTADMYMAAGAGNQRLYIIPSLDMVVVRQAAFGNWDDREFMSRLIGGGKRP